MVSRLAVLIAATGLAACLRAPDRRAGAGCVACHSPHHERVATCAACHRGDPAAARKDLAHARLLTGRVAWRLFADSEAVALGSRLADAAACRRCHRIAGSGNRYATDLDGVVAGREQAELVSSIRRPTEDMPDFGFDRRQAEAVVAFLLQHARAEGAPPYRVLLEHSAPAGPRAFEAKCGPCHRRLGPDGPRGSGTAGPNLSGLFTPFYPPTAPGGGAWDAAALEAWLRNPRAARAATTMPPIPLRDDELAEVLADLGPVRPASGSAAGRPPSP